MRKLDVFRSCILIGSLLRKVDDGGRTRAPRLGVAVGIARFEGWRAHFRVLLIYVNAEGATWSHLPMTIEILRGSGSILLGWTNVQVAIAVV